MLELRTHCENCKKELPNNSDEAMICSYECTFCKTCVEQILFNVCPNCGGGFEKRPSRPKADLLKHPQNDDIIFKPVKHNAFLKHNRHIEPRER